MLHVHRASDGVRLASALADVLAVPSGDPFAPVTVAVPARGVERWLTQRLSHVLGAVDDDGVCANVRFPSPAELLDGALAEVSPELGAAVEAWREPALVWPLVRLLGDLPDEPELAAVRSWLDSPASRRYALAAKAARLFRSYADDRPELLRTWATEAPDCPDDLRWQVTLWRLLRAQVGPSPAELHAEACRRLRADPTATGLPAQVCVYGLSRITSARLDALAALAVAREVHLFVHHPGAALWDAVAVPPDARRSSTAAPALASPLLASLGRDVRELQQRLLRAVPDLVPHLHDEPPRDTTLLQRLQRDLRLGAAPTLPTQVDDSVQVHACHGPGRQVEVLRDVVLGLLDADPSLEPRDVVVLCPDVETYAPLVAAAFGPSAHPAHRLRVALADRSPRQTNPLLGLAARLLTLAGSRVTAAEVLDLAGSPAVRERFALADDDLARLRGWVVGARVHWGLDADHRSAWGLGTLGDGTWRTGLDRLLTGAVLGGGESRAPWQGVLPHDALDPAGLELLGRCAELLDRLEHAVRALRSARTACEWLEALEAAVDELGAAPVDAPWQSVQLRRSLAALRAHAGDAPAELADMTALLGDVLAGRPTRTSFRTGALTVCTLTPMRSVPHRVVVLLGLDDGAFPRSGLPDADDVLARDPRLGERDPRSEDRQLFLDALLAARQHLVVLYTGAHVRTGAELPPAVPVGELLDAVGQGVVRRHPLQPFDPRAFAADRPSSYDPVAHAGAVAASRPPDDPPPFLDGPVALPQADGEPRQVELQSLVELLLHPSRGFLRQRLEVTSTARAEEPSSELPIELDGLEQWEVGDRMLQARLAGGSRAALTAAERARGALPPGPLGDALLERIGPCVFELAEAARPHLVGDPQTVDADVPLAGWRLGGSVPRLHGRCLVTVTYSRLAPKQRLRAWVELLALAAHDDGPWQAVLVGRAHNGSPLVETLAAPRQQQARAHLAFLAQVRAVGLQTPLALPVEAAAAYAQARREGEGVDAARDKAGKAWTSPFGFDGPDRDADHALVWGREAPFSTLWSWRSPVPLPPGGSGESGHFARLACALWFPVLDAEVHS